MLLRIFQQRDGLIRLHRASLQAPKIPQYLRAELNQVQQTFPFAFTELQKGGILRKAFFLLDFLEQKLVTLQSAGICGNQIRQGLPCLLCRLGGLAEVCRRQSPDNGGQPGLSGSSPGCACWLVTGCGSAPAAPGSAASSRLQLSRNATQERAWNLPPVQRAALPAQRRVPARAAIRPAIASAATCARTG